MTDAAANPRHVAIIMDGNGRWAQRRGLPRIKGHEAGAESVRAALEVCRDEGIEYLTLYAFSVENWVRPPDEVNGLMGLLPRFLQRYAKDLHEHHIRLRAIGRLDDLPAPTRKVLDQTVADTAGYDRSHLILALSYGGRTEIADAARKLATDAREGRVAPGDIDERLFARYLYAPDVPDPDLMIRTSGGQRISNFLLWQLSYAEFVFAPEYWPEFRREAFMAALAQYKGRARRFGAVK